MSKPVLTGFPQSTYVWTSRAALGMKGVDFEFRSIAPPANRSPEHLARHPWGKVPVFEHGDVTLYETVAVCEYVDGAFDGPALIPDAVADRARMRQMISIADCYLYPPAVVRYALQYIFPRGEGGAPDRAVIEEAVPDIAKAVGVLADALGSQDWFVGDGPTLADLHVGPLLALLTRFPESKAIMAEHPSLQAYVGRLMGIEAVWVSAPG